MTRPAVSGRAACRGAARRSAGPAGSAPSSDRLSAAMLLALAVLLSPLLGPGLLGAAAAAPDAEAPGLAALASARAASERCLGPDMQLGPGVLSSPRAFLREHHKPTGIRLQSWRHRPTHRLITTIFKIFLTEVMAYDNVTIEFTADVELPFADIVNSLSHLGTTDEESIRKPMVNLEVWASPRDTATTPWLSKALDVVDVGHITDPGRLAWYIPFYKNVNNTEPFSDISWKVFTDASKVQRFSVTIEDYRQFEMDSLLSDSNRNFYCNHSFCRNGRYVPKKCQKTTCATLFASYSDLTDFVVKHIEELQLYVEVMWVGPHLIDITSKLASKYRSRGANQEVIILSSLPTELMHSDIRQYTIVLFPPCEDFALRGLECKYELMRLIKLSWSEIAIHATPAYDSIRKVEFGHEDYMILLKESMRKESSSDEKIACDWLRNNTKRWKNWTLQEKVIINIGVLLPPLDKGISIAAIMSKIALNSNSRILQDYTVELLLNEINCINTETAAIDFLDDKTLIGALGPPCSDALEALASLSTSKNRVVISYKADSGNISDRSKYPYFFRTIGENSQYKFVYLQLFQKIGWSQVAAITEDGHRNTEYLSHLQDLMPVHGFQFISNRKFPHNHDSTAIHNYLKEFKSKNARIIISDVDDDATRSLMCAAYHLDMTSEHGYVWFLPYWPVSRWYDMSFLTNHTDFNCSMPQILEAINGHFALKHQYFAEDHEIMQENITVREWRETYEEKCANTSVSPSEYAGFVYDAVWALGVALDQFLKKNPTYISHLHTNETARQFAEVVRSTNFNGLSGYISLDDFSRHYSIDVVQWRKNNTYVVGTYFPNASAPGGQGRLDLNISGIEWMTTDGSIPWDGKETCFLSGIAHALDVNCEVATVISNITFFGLVAIVVAVLVIIKKRQYDQQLRKQMQIEKYLKSHGIDLLASSNISCLDEWEIPRELVVVNRKLGHGAFGLVYGGEANIDGKGWVDVAVKTLKVGSTIEDKLDFLSEAEVMKRLDHKNIVKLIGICTKSEPVLTVMEFMLYGDLKTYLLSRRNSAQSNDSVSSKRLTSMAHDVACALSYLAELKYVHRDVASRNCLVHSSHIVKLGDFGMTRPIFEADYYKFNRKGMLPVRWMSPESLALGVFTTASDVWAFGVLLYEIITFGSFPFQGLSNNEVLEHVKAGNTITIPKEVKPKLESLIRSCWNIDHKKRPQASEIVALLADNPCLLSPYVDAPLASVATEGSGEINFLNINTGRSQPVDFKPNIPQDTTQTILLDSSVCSTEPLLGTPRSTGGMGFSKYVTLHHAASRRSPEHPADYSSEDTEVVSIL